MARYYFSLRSKSLATNGIEKLNLLEITHSVRPECPALLKDSSFDFICLIEVTGVSRESFEFLTK